MMDSQEKNLETGKIEEQNVEQAAVENNTASQEVATTETARRNYATKEEVLERVKEIAHSSEAPDKEEVDLLKTIFYKLHVAERDAKLKEYLDAGGDPEAYQITPDETEEAFKAEMGIIREKRAEIFKQQEAEKEENLKKNNMEFFFAESAGDVRGIVESLMNDGDTVSHGGSVSMDECGIRNLLTSGKYNYLDRSKAATREEVEEIYRKTFSADVFISSANAITDDGVLYNVDGNSNRIAAIAFGPNSVIIIAGYNKIVHDLAEAEVRVKTQAAPPNCVRLNCDTYCGINGECVSLNKAGHQMSDGCSSDSRICCNYLISAQQRHKGRIKVIIVGEELGY